MANAPHQPMGANKQGTPREQYINKHDMVLQSRATFLPDFLGHDIRPGDSQNEGHACAQQTNTDQYIPPTI